MVTGLVLGVTALTLAGCSEADQNQIKNFAMPDPATAQAPYTFDLWKWAAMALGAKGMLLGWLPAVQAKIRAQADKGLRAYMAKDSSPG